MFRFLFKIITKPLKRHPYYVLLCYLCHIVLFLLVNISQNAFETLAHIIHRVQELQEPNQEKHGRNSLLSSYVSYIFNTPGSRTPVPSPNATPGNILTVEEFIFSVVSGYVA